MDTCPLCNNPEISFYLKIENYNIFRCNSCELQFINPLPSDNVIEHFYAKSTYHSEERYDIYKQSWKNSRVWKKRLNKIKSLGYKKGNILDIGCATGMFLKIAKEIGWNIKGLEISMNAANIAERLLGKNTVDLIDIMKFKSDKKYDVVTLWAVIEHVKDPLIYLKKIYSLLRPNGLLTLSTPNSDSISRIFLKNNWRYYIPPEHLFYFNKKSIMKALSQAGFKVVKMNTSINYSALFNNKDSAFLYFFNKVIALRILIKILLFPLILINKFFYLGDTMEIYAIRDRL